jgi:hypothetical protein
MLYGRGRSRVARDAVRWCLRSVQLRPAAPTAFKSRPGSSPPGGLVAGLAQRRVPLHDANRRQPGSVSEQPGGLEGGLEHRDVREGRDAPAHANRRQPRHLHRQQRRRVEHWHGRARTQRLSRRPAERRQRRAVHGFRSGALEYADRVHVCVAYLDSLGCEHHHQVDHALPPWDQSRGHLLLRFSFYDSNSTLGSGIPFQAGTRPTTFSAATGVWSDTNDSFRLSQLPPGSSGPAPGAAVFSAQCWPFSTDTGTPLMTYDWAPFTVK